MEAIAQFHSVGFFVVGAERAGEKSDRHRRDDGGSHEVECSSSLGHSSSVSH